MCVVIRLAGAVGQDVAWDAREVAVVVRAGLPIEEALAAVQAVLADLGSVAPGQGLWCFCGDPVVWPFPLSQPRVRVPSPVLAASPAVP